MIERMAEPRNPADTFGAYLDVLGEPTPQLTPELESELSALVQAGVEAQKRLTEGAAKEEPWSEAVRKGEEAVRILVTANLPLVVHIAQRFTSDRGEGLTDLLQDGMVALILAAQNFKAEKQKFSIYAGICIGRAFSDHISQKSVGPVTIPRGIAREVSYITSFLANTPEEVGVDALAAALDIKPKNVVRGLRLWRARMPVSTDQFIDAAGNRTVADILASNEDTESEALGMVTKSVLLRALDRLPEAEATAVRHYFLERQQGETPQTMNSSTLRAGLSMLRHPSVHPLLEKLEDNSDDAYGTCASIGLEPFFSTREVEVRQAKAICGNCAIRAMCLDRALSSNSDKGVWGGLSERERRLLKKRSI